MGGNAELGVGDISSHRKRLGGGGDGLAADGSGCQRLVQIKNGGEEIRGGRRWGRQLHTPMRRSVILFQKLIYYQ
jgi:hypothetical protein